MDLWVTIGGGECGGVVGLAVVVACRRRGRERERNAICFCWGFMVVNGDFVGCLWWSQLVEEVEERERVNINSKFFFSWGFTFGLVAVLWVVGCSGGGIGF